MPKRFALPFIVILVVHILIIPLQGFCAGQEPTEPIDRLLAEAINKGLVAGGVVLVGNRSQVLFAQAYGAMASDVGPAPLTVDTLFDLASLTKVFATTPAILKLAEEGRLSLVSPVSHWFPEFTAKDKDDLLVYHLLTHTSGLDDIPLAAVDSMQSAIDGAATQRTKGELGSRFRYADINFILLGELVRRVSGLPLDIFTAVRIFIPLGMNDTLYGPGPDYVKRCAPTLGADRRTLFGQVQDHAARQLGGVAGHAGLFSTAGDLALFCRMLLNEGELDGRRIFAERTVRQMTAPYFVRGGEVIRGLGWDIASPFSSPRGNGFTAASYGHTGYSGSSVWIDPERDLFVVFLTVRLDYRNLREFSQLRGELSSVAVRLFAATPPMGDLEEGTTGRDQPSGGQFP